MAASVKQRRSRKQPPPRPAPGGHALVAAPTTAPIMTGFPRPPHRPDPRRPTDSHLMASGRRLPGEVLSYHAGYDRSRTPRNQPPPTRAEPTHQSHGLLDLAGASRSNLASGPFARVVRFRGVGGWVGGHYGTGARQGSRAGGPGQRLSWPGADARLCRRHQGVRPAGRLGPTGARQYDIPLAATGAFIASNLMFKSWRKR